MSPESNTPPGPSRGPSDLARSRFGREHPNVLLQAFAIQNLSRELLQRAFAGLSLDPRDWGVLSVLRAFGPQTPTALAAFLGMAPTTLSSSIARLSRRRLVRKRRNPDDGRSYLLEVSASGEELIRRAGPSFRDALERINAALGERREDVLDAQAALTEALRRALANSTKSQ
jgi:DNA-binding MarR family transcriptional regulator